MSPISTLDFIIYAIALFGASIMSGIAGGGGGFITTPLLIFLGLPPAQAVATGKISGLSITLGSLSGMKGVKKASRRRLGAIITLAFIIGLLAPLVIINLDSEVYKNLLAVLLLLMIPVLILKKVGHAETTPSFTKKLIGYGLLAMSLFLQAVFSGGLGSLVNIVLMSMLGMPAIEANVTKRYSQVVLNTVIVLGVLSSGLIYWPIALLGVLVAGIGGYIGGKIAVKRGNKFIMAIFIILMFVSAIGLLLS